MSVQKKSLVSAPKSSASKAAKSGTIKAKAPKGEKQTNLGRMDGGGATVGR